MANRPRKEQASEGKYAGREFLTYEEAADYLGVRRSTLYSRVTQLGIQTKKFKLDKKRYLAMADVRRIKEISESPWLAGEDTEEASKQEPALVA